MIYIPDYDIERFLLEDIALGDLTTRSLGIKNIESRMRFIHRKGGRVSGVSVAKKVAEKLGLKTIVHLDDGTGCNEGALLLEVTGDAQAAHQGWKVSQNILEWCCGVAQYTAQLVAIARQENPDVQIACTRKSIPGTKILAIKAVLDGGGVMHRCGTAETILLFANHRRFLSYSHDWKEMVSTLRQSAPERKIVVEADTIEEAQLAIEASPDWVQLDKFTPAQISTCIHKIKIQGIKTQIAAAGGINIDNIAQFAATGVPLIVTSAAYYSKPADIQVVLEPWTKNII